MQRQKKSVRKGEPTLIDFPVQEGAPEQKAPGQKRDLKYLWVYAVGIFSVAVVLVLLSFFSQSRREGELAQQHMNFSASALKSIETMRQENDALQQDNAALNLAKNALISQISELQLQLDALLESNEQLRGELSDVEGLMAQTAEEYRVLLEELESMRAQENEEGE